MGDCPGAKTCPLMESPVCKLTYLFLQLTVKIVHDFIVLFVDFNFFFYSTVHLFCIIYEVCMESTTKEHATFCLPCYK